VITSSKGRCVTVTLQGNSEKLGPLATLRLSVITQGGHGQQTPTDVNKLAVLIQELHKPIQLGRRLAVPLLNGHG
jgi:hypothetical protein